MPAMTADEWWTEKKNSDPVLVPMSSDGIQQQQVQGRFQKGGGELRFQK